MFRKLFSAFLLEREGEKEFLLKRHFMNIRVLVFLILHQSPIVK